MSLLPSWELLLEQLSLEAAPLDGEFFRSVECRWAYPDDVISGEGTRLSGGRFVRRGVRAVYAALSEEGALHEAAARKERLGGQRQIEWRSFPRVTYIIQVRLARHVNIWLSTVRARLRPIVDACLTDDLGCSQEVGEFLRVRGVQGIVYPSAVPGHAGANVVTFRDVKPEPEIILVNREEILRLFEAWAERRRREVG